MSFTQRGENFFLYNITDGILDRLPVGTYSVDSDPVNGFYLCKEPAMELPSKMYGGVEEFASRVVTTFKDKNTHMGVLLEGEKGSGKSLQAKAIVQEALKAGFSTFRVESAFRGSNFNSFLGKFTEPFVLLFDEFEKVYGRDEQAELLSLFDGTVSSHFLAVLTVNDLFRVDQNIINRPGRAHYRVSYHKLEEEVVSQYCRENLRTDLRDKEADITGIHRLSGGFNFDMLQCLVEEVNRYGENPKDLLKILNIDVNGEENGNWKITSVTDPHGEEVNLKLVNGDTHRSYSPLLDKNLELRILPADKPVAEGRASVNMGSPKVGYRTDALELKFKAEDIDPVATRANQLVFVSEGYTIVYTNTPSKNRWF